MHRVLLADDEPWAAYALKHLVNWEKQGFLVIDTVFNGMEALSKCEALQPQVLITDIRMPEMDGLELLTAVRVKVKGIKVILVSGYSDFDYARQAIRHGAFDYLVKPIASAELTDLLVRIKAELGVVPQERPSITVDEQSSTPIKKALDYIEKNYEKEISVSEIASTFGIGANYFSTVFKKMVNMTYTEYVQARRIDKAKKLLRGTDMPIQNIADEVGYSDYFHFEKLFKREVGETPGKYRNEGKTRRT